MYQLIIIIWSGKVINYYQPPVETLSKNYYVHHQRVDENMYLRMAMGNLLTQSTLFERDVELQIKRMDEMLDSFQVTREDSLFMKSLESSAGKFIRGLYKQFRSKWHYYLLPSIFHPSKKKNDQKYYGFQCSHTMSQRSILLRSLSICLYYWIEVSQKLVKFTDLQFIHHPFLPFLKTSRFLLIPQLFETFTITTPSPSHFIDHEMFRVPSIILTSKVTSIVIFRLLSQKVGNKRMYVWSLMMMKREVKIVTVECSSF